MQRVVNGLWESGAEAVSINGQRLTALSAMRAAGDAILVDNKPLVPPYTVLAVGAGQ
ncbi:membrane protein [Streptomyces purpurascens]